MNFIKISIAKIAVENTRYSFDKLFSYFVPVEFLDKIHCGMRVLVPFGKGNRKRQGLIFDIITVDDELLSQEDRQYTKYIFSIIDDQPVVKPNILSLIKYIKNQTFCTFFEAVKLVLPPGINYEFVKKLAIGDISELDTEKLTLDQLDVINYLKQSTKGCEKKKLIKQLKIKNDIATINPLLQKNYIVEMSHSTTKVKDSNDTIIKITQNFDTLELDVNYRVTPKQKKVLELLTINKTAFVKEVMYICGVTKIVLDNICKMGYASYEQIEVYRSPLKNKKIPIGQNKFTLNEQQLSAYNGILSMINQNNAAVALLYGVTGSGKTQVFIKLIEDVIRQGKTVIMMVPEIALTPQMIDKFYSFFGDICGVIHSGLSLGQRYDEYKRIKKGLCKIVIGTRSAVFAPVENIGLIIMDEEQEATYKSDSNPRYHARDIAKYRCFNENAVLLLASATPSIETYYNAINQKYQLFTLDTRYNQTMLPQVEIIDLKDDEQKTNDIEISRKLLEEIGANIDRGEQTILLLNRRGFSTIAQCIDCGEVVSCPNCSVALTYHKANQRLMCHYCGYSTDKKLSCEKCNCSHMKYTGFGTQRAFEIIEKYYPNAKIMRIDADTTMSRYAYEEYFNKFKSGEADILIGTQMVAKGLDFPNVTLVGILLADSALYANDFRSYERAFSLLTQVIGRCGRGEKKGRAFIQTLTPQNDILELSANQDYIAYYQKEIVIRKVMLYPPFCNMCLIGFSSGYENYVQDMAKEFLEILLKLIPKIYKEKPIKIYGPISSNINKINNKYRYKIMIKSVNTKEFRFLIAKCLELSDRSPLKKYVRIFADLNYDSNF